MQTVGQTNRILTTHQIHTKELTPPNGTVITRVSSPCLGDSFVTVNGFSSAIRPKIDIVIRTSDLQRSINEDEMRSVKHFKVLVSFCQFINYIDEFHQFW